MRLGFFCSLICVVKCHLYAILLTRRQRRASRDAVGLAADVIGRRRNWRVRACVTIKLKELQITEHVVTTKAWKI